MLDPPKTISEALKYKYNRWSGNPKGDEYDIDICAWEVSSSWSFFQCSRKNGYGVNGLYCKQHSKMMNKLV